MQQRRSFSEFTYFVLLHCQCGFTPTKSLDSGPKTATASKAVLSAFADWFVAFQKGRAVCSHPSAMILLLKERMCAFTT